MKPLAKVKTFRTSFEKLLPFISVVVMVIVLSLSTDRFLTWGNISNIMRQHAQIIIMAVGMTFVIVSRGIDLSVGSLMALAGICGTLLMTAGASIIVAILGGCFAGLVCGSVNGLLISRLKISPFIATLGTMEVFRGLVLHITKGVTVDEGIPRSFGILRNGNLSDLIPIRLFDLIPIAVIVISLVGSVAILMLLYAGLGKRLHADRIPIWLIVILLMGALAVLIVRYAGLGEYLPANRIPIPVILTLLIAVLASLTPRLPKSAAVFSVIVLLITTLAVMVLRLRTSVPIPLILILSISILASLTLRYTRLGRYSYAIGSNVEAAHHSGIRVGAYIVLIYAVCGFLAGLAGMIECSGLVSGPPTAGGGYELRVIAAVVIGGGSLMGGEGTVSGTIAGALLMALLLNGCVHWRISDFVQRIVIGALIVVAVAFDQLRKRKMERGGT